MIFLLIHASDLLLVPIKCIRNRQLVSTYCIMQVYFSYQETDLVVVQAQNIRAHFSLVTENIIVITRYNVKRQQIELIDSNYTSSITPILVLVLVYTQEGSLWSIVLRCDHTGIFTCDGCARDPYFYVPAETQS